MYAGTMRGRADVESVFVDQVVLDECLSSTSAAIVQQVLARPAPQVSELLGEILVGFWQG